MKALRQLAADLESGRTKSRTLVESCLAAIDQPDGEGARTFIAVDREGARMTADHVDGLRRRGVHPSRFAGIPISVKDLFDLAGEVTRAGSLLLSDNEPAVRDAPSMARLKAAGFIIIGRTNMTEFAYSGIGANPHYGTPACVWDRATGRVPGGSSSGAAISVADGMAAGAIGTDTGGSCRIPAAFNGICGYKPTQSRVPRDGVYPLSFSLDSVGPFGHTVDCCAILDAAMAGDSDGDIDPPAPERLRFGVLRTLVLEDLDEHVARSFEAALTKLSATGIALVDIDLPAIAEIPALYANGGMLSAEAYALHKPMLEAHFGRYDPRVAKRITLGKAHSASDYIHFVEARRRMIAEVGRSVHGIDALLMPTVAILPPAFSDLEDDDTYFRTNALTLRNTAVFNFLDGCALSIPMHEPGTPPAGLMVAGLNGWDRHVLSAGATVEAVVRTALPRPR